jgi:hypothetical protein
LVVIYATRAMMGDTTFRKLKIENWNSNGYSEAIEENFPGFIRHGHSKISGRME